MPVVLVPSVGGGDKQDRILRVDVVILRSHEGSKCTLVRASQAPTLGSSMRRRTYLSRRATAPQIAFYGGGRDHEQRRKLADRPLTSVVGVETAHPKVQSVRLHTQKGTREGDA